MTDAEEVLEVELEDASARSALVGLLRTLSQATQQWHFVAAAEGELRYESPTFAGPPRRQVGRRLTGTAVRDARAGRPSSRRTPRR